MGNALQKKSSENRISTLPEPLLQAIFEGLDSYEMLVLQRVCKRFQGVVNAAVPRLYLQTFHIAPPPQLSPAMVKNALVEFLKSKPVDLECFQFAIQYDADHVFPLDLHEHNLYSILKVPKFDDLTVTPRLAIYFKRRFQTRVRTFAFEDFSMQWEDIGPMGWAFLTPMQWKDGDFESYVAFLHKPQECNVASIEEWGDSWLIKFMKKKGTDFRPTLMHFDVVKLLQQIFEPSPSISN